MLKSQVIHSLQSLDLVFATINDLSTWEGMD